MATQQQTKKILIALTSHSELGSTGKKTGYYLPEVTHAYFKFVEMGFEVKFVSPQGGCPPMDPNGQDLNDELNKKFLTDSNIQKQINNTLAPHEVNPLEYSALFFAGGHGTMWDFRTSQSLLNIGTRIYENGGIVSAVCHGPAALVNMKLSNGDFLISGKKVTGFSNAEEDAIELTPFMPFQLETELKNSGSYYSKSELWQEYVVVDGRLVTGQNPASTSLVAEKVLSLL